MYHLARLLEVHFLLFRRSRLQDDEVDVRGVPRPEVFEYSHPSSNAEDTVVAPQMPVVGVPLEVLVAKQSHADRCNTPAA